MASHTDTAGATTAGAAPHRRRALLAAAVSAVLVGAAMVSTRAVAHEMGPFSLAWLRYAIAAACLAPLVGLRWWPLWRGADGLRIAALGIVQFGVLIALLNRGLQELPAGLAALLFATFPLLAMVLAVAVGHERWRAGTASGIAISIGGVALVLGVGAPELGSGRLWLGTGCVLAAALCGAACAVAYGPLMRRHPALPVGLLAMLATVAALALPAWAEGLPQAAQRLGPAAWAHVGFIGLASAVGYWTWLWALGHARATEVTAFLGLGPVTAMLLGAATLGEPIGAAAVAGTGLVIAGLVLATRAPAS